MKMLVGYFQFHELRLCNMMHVSLLQHMLMWTSHILHLNSHRWLMATMLNSKHRDRSLQVTVRIWLMHGMK